MDISKIWTAPAAILIIACVFLVCCCVLPRMIKVIAVVILAGAGSLVGYKMIKDSKK
jgi:hypothetical protein